MMFPDRLSDLTNGGFVLRGCTRISGPGRREQPESSREAAPEWIERRNVRPSRPARTAECAWGAGPKDPRRAGAVVPDRVDEVEGHPGGVGLLGRDGPRPLERCDRAGQDIEEIGVAVGDEQVVVERQAAWYEPWTTRDWSASVSTSTTHPSECRSARAVVPCSPGHAGSACPRTAGAEIDEVAEMVPENIVGPAPFIAGCTNVHQAPDKEPAGDMANCFLACPDAGQEVGALVLEAHRVAEPVDFPARLAGPTTRSAPSGSSRLGSRSGCACLPRGHWRLAPHADRSASPG